VRFVFLPSHGEGEVHRKPCLPREGCGGGGPAGGSVRFVFLPSHGEGEALHPKGRARSIARLFFRSPRPYDCMPPTPVGRKNAAQRSAAWTKNIALLGNRCWRIFIVPSNLFAASDRQEK
jgi:hypothetical protein